MGKFKPGKIKEKLREQEIERKRSIRRVLRSKKLIRVIRDRNTRLIKDGRLLFGSHKDKKVSELLNSFDYSDYVLGYLSNSEDLPKGFKKVIQTIIKNFDPFNSPRISGDLSPYEGLNVKEIDPDDDIPF